MAVIDNAFIHITKTAGTSVKRIFREFISLKCGHENANEVLTMWKSHCHGQGRESSPLYLFTFMRNPYARIISAYEFRHRESVNTAAGKTLIEYGKDISFKTYVELITDPQEKPDDHWWPQMKWILDAESNEVIVDYIGRTETFEKDIENIADNIFLSEEDRASFNPGDAHDNPSPWRQSENKDYKDYYDDETRKKVEKYYELDIDYLKVKF